MQHVQVSDISFCDKVAYNIRSDDVKQHILNELEQHFHVRILHKHFDKYCPATHDPILKASPHLVCAKSNGNPYYLYLTQLNSIPQCVFIDKKIQQGYQLPRMILAKLWFDAPLYCNTLLEGEMVKCNDGGWQFILNDIIVDSGVHLETVNLVRRLKRMYHILEHQYTEDEVHLCRLKVKRYFHISDLDTMVDSFIPRLNHSVRGMCFKPLFLRFRAILYNFDDSLVVVKPRLKYKEFMLQAPSSPELELEPAPEPVPSELHHSKAMAAGSKALCICKTSATDVYEVYDPASHMRLGLAFVNSLKTAHMLRGVFACAKSLKRVTMHCAYNAKFNKWEPLHPVH